MKIADIRTIPLSYRCEEPYMSAAGAQMVRSALLVEIETDTGLVGIGEAGSAGGPLASTRVVVEQELKPLLLGEDPLRIEWLWQKNVSAFPSARTARHRHACHQWHRHCPVGPRR
jgi:L-alanine-DL-glutamate epimerase-like enolase superfamily enzyme